MILDFTVTTCLRPDILRRTLESFRENLKGVEWGKCRAFVNVDPAGPENNDTTFEIIDLIKSSFEGASKIHWARKASFPAAVKWCFAQPTTPFAMAIEDDWVLKEPIGIEDMMAQMTPQVCVVNLRAKNFRQGVTRAFLSPGLWRTSMMHAVAAEMDGVTNPEIDLWRITDRYRMGCYWPERIVIEDIGRRWLEKSGFAKNVNPEKGVNPFTHWKRVE